MKLPLLVAVLLCWSCTVVVPSYVVHRNIPLQDCQEGVRCDMLQNKPQAGPQPYRSKTQHMYKDGKGVYQVDITVGTPPKKLRVQLDTGSSDFGLIGTACSSCGTRVYGPFNPQQSTTWEKVGCSEPLLKCTGSTCCGGQCCYSISYTGGSGYKAIVGKDAMSFGEIKYPFNTTIGIINDVIGGGSGWDGSDGIMGLAYPSISAINATNPITARSQELYRPNVFTICMQSNSGTLNIGTPASPASQYDWTPVVQHNWWTVWVEDMRVFNTSVGISPKVWNQGTAVVDTGTTTFYMPTTAYANLEKIMTDPKNCKGNLVGICKNNPPGHTIFEYYCFSMTEADLDAYPDIEVVLRGIKPGSQTIVRIPPRAYVQQGWCTPATAYTLNIQGTDPSGGTYLADVMLIGHTTVWDRANSRLGFKRTDTC